MKGCVAEGIPPTSIRNFKLVFNIRPSLLKSAFESAVNDVILTNNRKHTLQSAISRIQVDKGDCPPRHKRSKGDKQMARHHLAHLQGENKGQPSRHVASLFLFFFMCSWTLLQQYLLKFQISLLLLSPSLHVSLSPVCVCLCVFFCFFTSSVSSFTSLLYPSVCVRVCLCECLCEPLCESLFAAALGQFFISYQTSAPRSFFVMVNLIKFWIRTRWLLNSTRTRSTLASKITGKKERGRDEMRKSTEPNEKAMCSTRPEKVQKEITPFYQESVCEALYCSKSSHTDLKFD